jgi:SAM-dependent methyltransferase
MSCCPPSRTPANGDLGTRDLVREKYASAVTSVTGGESASCCGSKATALAGGDPITRNLYSTDETSELPPDAVLASFGCGNPTALASLAPGETVLDLGSGGGIDVLLSAKRVGPTGKAIGLDMTPEMLALARKNAATANVTNVEFLQGNIENIPLADASVDVIISNCVINLSPDKDAVLAEAVRVLRPGGRFAVSDIVLTHPLPPSTQKNLELWAGCIAGALTETDYLAKLKAAGFESPSIEPTRVYTREDAEEIACGATPEDAEAQLAAIDGAMMSAFIRATKPKA